MEKRACGDGRQAVKFLPIVGPTDAWGRRCQPAKHIPALSPPRRETCLPGKAQLQPSALPCTDETPCAEGCERQAGPLDLINCDDQPSCHVAALATTPGVCWCSYTTDSAFHNRLLPLECFAKLPSDQPKRIQPLRANHPHRPRPRPRPRLPEITMAQPYGYGAPPQGMPAYAPQSAQNLQFYPSTYGAPGDVSGHATPSQASYGYGASPSGTIGGGANFGFGPTAGVSGRMGEQGGLRTGWLAAFSAEGYEGEPSLLEELDINFGHIQAKVYIPVCPSPGSYLLFTSMLTSSFYSHRQWQYSTPSGASTSTLWTTATL